MAETLRADDSEDTELTTTAGAGHQPSPATTTHIETPPTHKTTTNLIRRATQGRTEA